MNVRWSPPATLALLNLPRADAEAVDRAVQRWAAMNEGFVLVGEQGAYLLVVDAYVVEFFVDTTNRVMHVANMRRA